ncbi:MAG: exonuclease domain-containing protein [Acutalibacteraceae bacterium]
MNFIILDMEWNGAVSRKDYKHINEIIEFGAVKVSENMEIIDRFSMLVKPQINKKISGKIKNLTHITNELLQKSGHTFTHVLSKFKKFVGENSIILTWGKSDIKTLLENTEYYLKTDRIDFISKYVDAQAFCSACLDVDITNQIGLQATAEMLNIDLDGVEHHRALDDSILAYECFKRVYSKEKLAAFIEDATSDDFYGRLMFKTFVILDIDDPQIDKSSITFDCIHCSGKTEQKTQWLLKGKNFVSSFYCPSCDETFTGRVQFKQKYDGVVVSKHAYLDDTDAHVAKTAVMAMCYLSDFTTRKVLLLNKNTGAEKSLKNLILPGGFVKKNESVTQALVRNVKEQTGLEISDIKLCGVADKLLTDTGEKCITFLFTADKYSGKLISQAENHEAVWTTIYHSKLQQFSKDMIAYLKIIKDESVNEAFLEANANKNDYLYS